MAFGTNKKTLEQSHDFKLISSIPIQAKHFGFEHGKQAKARKPLFPGWHEEWKRCSHMVGVLNSAAFFGLRKFKFVLPTFLENVIRVTAYKLLHSFI